MRTVTFSNPKVAERVNASFVPVWYNRGPGFHNCEKETESWIFSSSADCYPTKNICTFFLTPDLEAVYYVAGYWAPDLFLEILDDVLELQEEAGRAERHEKIARALAARHDELRRLSDKAPPDAGLKSYGSCRYEQTEHRHRPQCRYVVREALRYRREVHQSVADAGGAVPFGRVQHDYKYGNPFTEEAPVETVPTGFATPQAPSLPAQTPTPGRKEKK